MERDVEDDAGMPVDDGHDDVHGHDGDGDAH
jgi:hypothetical protein